MKINYKPSRNRKNVILFVALTVEMIEEFILKNKNCIDKKNRKTKMFIWVIDRVNIKAKWHDNLRWLMIILFV